MRRRSRLRTAVKWAGTVACGLILLAAGGSAIWSVSISGRAWFVFVFCGSVETAYVTHPGGGLLDDLDDYWFEPGFFISAAALRMSRSAYSYNWTHGALWPEFTWGGESFGGETSLRVPLWIPLALIGMPTLWLWRSDRRRARRGCCTDCGYNLTGNVTGRCSECGGELGSAE